MLGYAALLFAMYSVVPYMLRLSGSTLFNLSLLTSDAYAIIFGMFFFSKVPSWLYFIALTIIVGGLLCYNVRNEPVSAVKAEETPSLRGYDEICEDVTTASSAESAPPDDTAVVSLNADEEDFQPRPDNVEGVVAMEIEK